MKRLGVPILVTLLFLFANTAIAHHPPTPATLEGVKILSIEEAKMYVDKQGIVVVDSRKAQHYAGGHIKNAISLPYKWVTLGDIPTRKGKFDLSRLPSDKNAEIIFYSDGEHNWDSYNASKEARDAGYKCIMWFRDGYNGWIKKGYPVEQ